MTLNAVILQCWTGTDFKTQQRVGRVTLQLPDGPTVDVDVPADYVLKLLAMSEEPVAPNRLTAPLVETRAPVHIEKTPDNTLVDWRDPACALTDEVKSIFHSLNLPSPLPAKAINEYIEQLSGMVPPESAEVDEAVATLHLTEAPEDAPQPPVEEPTLRWDGLSVDKLPLLVKLAMREQNLPEVLAVSRVVQIRDAFLREYGPADWARLQAKYPDAIPSVPQPKIGTVQFSDGAVVRPSVPSRTVPKNDAGYPIVPGREHDLGEQQPASDMDDDGVPQY